MVQEEEIRQIMTPWQDEYQHEYDETQAEGHKLNQKIMKECGCKWPPDNAETT